MRGHKMSAALAAILSLADFGLLICSELVLALGAGLRSDCTGHGTEDSVALLNAPEEPEFLRPRRANGRSPGISPRASHSSRLNSRRGRASLLPARPA